ncbi:hypothetical protein ACH5RR_036238 [Cinchona calisaya]|uniref:Cullin family profile domain-containing protein n=1 Tax=Cinchona calisaya TaxID=153742 RepID=A0ABD2Y676_9GENT
MERRNNHHHQKKKFQTEEFKYKQRVVDEEYVDKTWKTLQQAIHDIYNHNEANVSPEELYRNAYTMVLHKFGEKLYSGLVTTMTFHLQEMAKTVKAAQDSSFLEELNRKWIDHKKASQIIRDIMMYMDRTFIPTNHKTPIRELGLNLWRDNVIHSSQIQTRLFDTLLELILRERSDEAINRDLIRNTIQMLMDLGSSVYQQDFEKPFLEVLTPHLRDTGKQILTDPGKLKNPVEFVQCLLNEKDKYDRIINLGFGNDNTFQNALNSSLEYLINLNPRCPEFISLFADEKLQKLGLKGGVTSEEEVEIVLDKVIMLFGYLQEKDLFKEYYKQHLAQRLLLGESVSDDAERSLILKLKTECGYQFTSELEGLFTEYMKQNTIAEGH